jgi:hypothetical protein
MIRRSILSVLGGVVFAAALSLGGVANAACFGLCPDRVGNYLWEYCNITFVFDRNTGEIVGIAAVECLYTDTTGSLPVDPIIAE